MLVILLIGLIPAWLIIINFSQESIFNYDYANAALESGQKKLQACTEEAKICPDGSAVGRSGPNCEFAPCPKEIENSICKNLCGDGTCQERVCMGTGCPCLETSKSCPQDCAKSSEDALVGNDRDEHGCIGSAGYSWCEVKQKCLRVWEEKCTN